MGTETVFKFLIKFADNERQSLRWNRFFHSADLVDAFFWTGLVIFQKIIHSAVALNVPGFLVPGVLSIDMVGIMLVVIHPFNFFKAEIRLLRVFPKVVGGKAPVTVPVHILSGTLSVNVFAIFYIEPTVIVPGIVSAMLPRSSIVSC